MNPNTVQPDTIEKKILINTNLDISLQFHSHSFCLIVFYKEEKMQHIGPEQASQTIIPFFLRSLMKLERERQGISRQAASSSAKWSTSTWGHLERNTRPLQPHHWMNISLVLNLSADREVRRLNAFIGKHPILWLQMGDGQDMEICEKSLTSPRAIRGDNVLSVDLNKIRPALYYELSRFTVEPEEIISCAKSYGFFQSRIEDSQRPSFPKTDPQEKIKNKRDQISRRINTSISEDKLAILERVVHKFENYSVKELAKAYQHFSLCLKS